MQYFFLFGFAVISGCSSPKEATDESDAGLSDYLGPQSFSAQSKLATQSQQVTIVKAIANKELEDNPKLGKFSDPEENAQGDKESADVTDFLLVSDNHFEITEQNSNLILPVYMQTKEQSISAVCGSGCPVNLEIGVDGLLRFSPSFGQLGLYNFVLDIALAESRTMLPLQIQVNRSYGNGSGGDLAVSGYTNGVNTCYPINENIDGHSVSVAGTFDEGSIVLLWQVQTSVGTPGQMTSLSPSSIGDAGLFELGEVAAISLISGSDYQVTLKSPLLQSIYKSDTLGNKAQICSVPQFDNVTISPTGSLLSVPWNGSTGGLLFMLVKDTLSISNQIDATFTGFRGGNISVEDSFPTDPFLYDFDFGTGFAGGKGESTYGLAYGWGLNQAGRGNYTNGGGGGSASYGGGGGGGNGGFGGNSGRPYSDEPIPGMGGANFLEGLEKRLSFGGGGGGGHSGGSGSVGETGGGLIYLIAKKVIGNGSIESNGVTALDENWGGGGGGGAGGSIILLSEDGTEFTGTISANGGGGSWVKNAGAGGGGGGGRILTQGNIAATKTVNGGLAGLNHDGFYVEDEPENSGKNGNSGLVIGLD
jgi:hypothetical protein